MTETAVGLFQHAGSADAVVEKLRARGIASSGIRILSKPTAMRVDSAKSTPSIDFAAGLAHDLSSMGATQQECEAYLDGVRHGNALVFVTGTGAEAETAVTVMNACEPIRLEEFVGAMPALPGMHQGEAEAHASVSLKVDQAREKSEGARIFTW
jgi:hypothetical protein